jgi:hypothetical protein
VGMGFAELVNDYTKLLEELEDKKWALKEIQNSVTKN